MIAALRYEWTRFWTVRSTYIMLGLALLLSAALSFLIVQATQSAGPDQGGPPPGTIDWFTSFSAPMTFAAVLASVLGAQAIGLALHGHPTPPAGVTVPDSTFFGRGIVFVVLWALSSFALAGITRQTAIGIAVPIVSGLIVENVLIGFFSEKATWLVEHLPWSSASRWAGNSDFVQGPSGWSGLAVFAVWVALFFIVELVLFMRRDA